MGTFWVLVFACTSKVFETYQKVLRFSNVALSGTSQFFPNHEKDGKFCFLNISLDCTSNFSQSTKELGY